MLEERATSADLYSQPSCKEGFRALAQYLHELIIEAGDDSVCLIHLNQ